MSHEDALRHTKSDGWHRLRGWGPIAFSLALPGAAGILAGFIMSYLDHNGPSGSSPHPWSYTGNGALAVFAYFPLVLLAGWSVLFVWHRGYRQQVAIVSGPAVFLSGLLAGLVNEIGVVGQLPDVPRTLPIVSPLSNLAVAVLALTVSLGLGACIDEVPPRHTILAIILTVLAVTVALALSLAGGWYSLTLTQSLLVPLTSLLPLLVGRPRWGRLVHGGAGCSPSWELCWYRWRSLEASFWRKS